MSGPKRADVQAALNTAARSAQASAAVIAKTNREAVGSMRRRLEDVVREGRGLTADLERLAADLNGLAGADPETGAARRAVDAALAALAHGAGYSNSLAADSRHADEAEDRARRAHAAAQAEYDKAERGLRQAGGHYLHNQMAWAQSARKQFDEAAALAKIAVTLREESKKSASRTVEAARAAVAEAQRAATGGQSAIRSTEQRVRAAAEAARITEEKRRAATSALSRATIIVESLNAASVDKFVPGARSPLETSVADAARALTSERFDDVLRLVADVPKFTLRAAAAAAEAQQRWDVARAAALTAHSDLEALLECVDTGLIRAWADDADAVTSARRRACEVIDAIAGEQFAKAGAAAIAERDRLASAVEVAAAAKGQDLRRREIGEAVMDVLEDLGFDISFEDGTREEPLRISGQTATVDGRGDFDIKIPLDGEIDFEVTANEGDVTCVNAIQNMQERLAERGIKWNVTDWGHAEEAVDGLTRSRTKNLTQTKSRSKG